MADRIQYTVSMDFIDDYTTENEAANDITGDIANVTTSYSRHHPTLGGSKGGSGRHNAGLATVSQSDVICTTSGTVLVNHDVSGVVIKHSGFTSAARDTPTTNTLLIRIGSGSGTIISRIPQGAAVVFPFTTEESFHIFGDSASGNICAEVTRASDST